MASILKASMELRNSLLEYYLVEKKWGKILSSALFCIAVLITVFVKTPAFEKTKKIYYELLFPSKYSFTNVSICFGENSLTFFDQVDKTQAEKYLVNLVPEMVRERFQYFLTPTLHLAQKYQIDPFWVLAIMWTESQYHHSVRSERGAIGPMQIMPDTGTFLTDRFSKDPGKFSLEKKHAMTPDINNPVTNIEMGILYLKYLLERFDHNPKLATMAYNMGPTRARGQMKKVSSEQQNLYYNKVQQAYNQLTQSLR